MSTHKQIQEAQAEIVDLVQRVAQQQQTSMPAAAGEIAAWVAEQQMTATALTRASSELVAAAKSLETSSRSSRQVGWLMAAVLTISAAMLGLSAWQSIQAAGMATQLGERLGAAGEAAVVVGKWAQHMEQKLDDLGEKVAASARPPPPPRR